MNRTKLVGILDVVSKAVERNNLIPIYEYFCFTGDTVFGFNDSFGIVAKCEVPEPFAIQGPNFLNWLKAVKEDKVDLEVKDNELRVVAGKAQTAQPIKGREDFVWTEPTLNKGGEIEYDLIKGIECCIPTASENLALEGFSRIYIGSFEGKLTVYSTDGDALTKYVTTIEGKANVCLARAFCEAVVKVGGGKMIIGDEWVCSLFEDYKVYGNNLGPATFDYEDYINKILEGPLPELTPIPLALDEALTRARVLADIETSPTRLFIEKNKIILATQTPFGEDYSEIKLNGKHPDAEAEISAALFQDNMEGCTDFRVMEKCCVFKGAQVLRLVSNL